MCCRCETVTARPVGLVGGAGTWVRTQAPSSLTNQVRVARSHRVIDFYPWPYAHRVRDRLLGDLSAVIGRVAMQKFYRSVGWQKEDSVSGSPPVADTSCGGARAWLIA